MTVEFEKRAEAFWAGVDAFCKTAGIDSECLKSATCNILDLGDQQMRKAGSYEDDDLRTAIILHFEKAAAEEDEGSLGLASETGKRMLQGTLGRLFGFGAGGLLGAGLGGLAGVALGGSGGRGDAASLGAVLGAVPGSILGYRYGGNIGDQYSDIAREEQQAESEEEVADSLKELSTEELRQFIQAYADKTGSGG